MYSESWFRSTTICAALNSHMVTRLNDSSTHYTQTNTHSRSHTLMLVSLDTIFTSVQQEDISKIKYFIKIFSLMIGLFSPNSVALCSADNQQYQKIREQQQGIIRVLQWHKGRVLIVQEEIQNFSQQKR